MGQLLRRLTTKKHANVLPNLIWIYEFRRWARSQMHQLRYNIAIRDHPYLDEAGVPAFAIDHHCM